MSISVRQFSCLLSLCAVQICAADPSEYAIPVTATIQVSPPQIQLS